jgi:low temperature requirement protein LtrA
MTAQSIVSPEDQKVTFVELFFDLVFVIAVAQVVAAAQMWHWMKSGGKQNHAHKSWLSEHMTV